MIVSVIIWSVTFGNGIYSVSDTVTFLRNEIVNKLEFQIETLMKTPLHAVELFDVFYSAGVLDPTDLESARRITYEIWKREHASLTSAYIGIADERFVMFSSSSPGILEERVKNCSSCLRVTQLVNPVTLEPYKIVGSSVYPPLMSRSWYSDTVERNTSMITNVYWFLSTGNLGVGYAIPLFRNGAVIAVGCVNIELVKLEALMSTISIAKTGNAFLVEGNGYLISSTMRGAIIFNQTRIAAVNNTNVVQAYVAQLLMNRFGSFQAIPIDKNKRYELGFTFQGSQYIADVSAMNYTIGLDWYIVSTLPIGADYLQNIYIASIISCAFVFLFVLFSIALSCGLSVSVTRPLFVLSRKMKRLKKLDFGNKSTKISKSMLKEIKYVQDAYLTMERGLDSFSKFVPKELVHTLVRTGSRAALGLSHRHCSILFLDIADFTTMTEQLAPEVLLYLLSSVFEFATKNIHETGGTLDKFIGDCVMAFWNAPERVTYPDLKACITALKCIRDLENHQSLWQAKGIPRVVIRIGINSGDVLVGNIGSKERFNYTVLGDPVNLTARLEPLNKNYGTTIIIGEQLLSNVSNFVETKYLDSVQVKGKSVETKIYELKSLVDPKKLKEGTNSMIIPAEVENLITQNLDIAAVEPSPGTE